MRAHVTFENVGHSFTGDAGPVEALRDVSFSLQSGEFVAVLGPSGCGKSTLLRLLCGLLQPTRGDVKVWDAAISGPQPEMGIVFQKPTLLPWKNVRDNVTFPKRYRAGRVSAVDRERARELLALVGLEEFCTHSPEQLSGGMQQRVALARALSLEPDILLMDEPFSALDAITREKLSFELLRILEQRPATVLFITHSIQEAVLLADRVLVLGPRPATLRADVRIELARPRNLATMADPAFTAYAQELRRLIHEASDVQARHAEEAALA